MWTLLLLSSVLIAQGPQVHSQLSTTEGTTEPPWTSAQPSCSYNCGRHMGTCSCRSSCPYYGDCCYDYDSHCQSTTVRPTTGHPSCRYNCGRHLGSCSCKSSCQYYGNCCHDVSDYCSLQTTWAPNTSAQPSCRYNCGRHLGSCSCKSTCGYYGNCCHDASNYCSLQTTWAPNTSAQPSCRYNCGRHLGSCSCESSCRYYGNCCYDYYSQCQSTTIGPTTAQPSCRYNCGRHLGSCSCKSSCQYNGNCCYDYYSQCQSTTVRPTTARPSCRYNCGRHLGSCSCTSSCRSYGRCCPDFDYYCPMPTTDKPCGGSLFGSGTLTSPNHPNYYNDNAYCVWRIRATSNQRVFLAFTYLQLDKCCFCDNIEVYDGPSIYSPSLGKVCNTTMKSFRSSSTDMTVIFKTDSSVVGRGFRAEFVSSLKPTSGQVRCSSEKMNIVIERSYLNSAGYDSHSLYLNDRNCRPTVNAYQVVFSFPIHSCGNIKQINNGRVVYTNSLHNYNTSSGEITRQSILKLNITCIMDQDSMSQNMFVVQQLGNSTIIGNGRFNTTMTFYTSSSFYYPVTEVPYEVELNKYLYVQVDLIGRDGGLVIFLDTCVASPSPHDFQTRAYYLVRNGCKADSTYYPYVSGSQSYAQFRVNTFQFLNATESVYLQCKVLICSASDYNSRCRRGCARRRARDLNSDHNSQTLVLGPIKLKDPVEKKEGSDQQDQA